VRRQDCGAALAAGGLGNALYKLGDSQQANALFLETLDIFRKLKDARGEALPLGNLAMVASRANDFEAAMSHGKAAVARFRLLADKQNLMTALLNMSNVAMRLTGAVEAAALLRESLDLCIQLSATRLSATRSLMFLFGNTASVAEILGKHVAAIQLHAAAAALRERLQLTRSEEYMANLELEINRVRLTLTEPVANQEWANGTLLSEQNAIKLAQSILALRF
jgi:tetratricopeptide (TPR) repeat protein